MKQSTNRRGGWKEDRILAFQNKGDAPEGLLKFVEGQLPDMKRADLKVWLKYSHMMVNGVVTKQFDHPVNPGDWVEVNATRPFVVFHHPRLSIVYEDDDIIVVNKGYGLLSVATGQERGKPQETAYSILKDYVKKKSPANKIFVVHRLDRHTSGLMMFAKSPEAQEAMQHNWNNMVLRRDYVAVCEGEMEEDSGMIKTRLAENSRYNVYSTKEKDEGKEAVTRYKVLERGHGLSLVEFSLDTGRKNQIRVHAHDLGHPIIGDKKYGSSKGLIHRLALHARTLRFAHPVTRKDMNFELPVPSRFVGVVRHGKTPE